MKQSIILAGSVVVALAMTGCTTSTELYDPTDTTSEMAKVCSLSTVSQAECFTAARAAAEDAMTSAPYANFLSQYKAENGNFAVPLMQVSDYLRNDTDDPDLNMRLITDVLTKELRDTGKVRITLAVGRDAKGTFADARDLKHDNNFKKSTVAKSGTLNAPRLSLEGSIITNTVRDGRRTVKVTTFNLKIADIETGEEVWSYNKPLGFQKTKPVLGF